MRFNIKKCVCFLWFFFAIFMYTILLEMIHPRCSQNATSETSNANVASARE